METGVRVLVCSKWLANTNHPRRLSTVTGYGAARWSSTARPCPPPDRPVWSAGRGSVEATTLQPLTSTVRRQVQLSRRRAGEEGGACHSSSGSPYHAALVALPVLRYVKHFLSVLKLEVFLQLVKY